MAHPKRKASAYREKLAAPEADVNGTTPAVAPLPVEAENTSGKGAQITLLIWFVGFSFLAVLMLWDLIAGLLFR